MQSDDIKVLLDRVKQGEISIDDATSVIRESYSKDLGFAVIDNHRETRVGYPEVIFCSGKTVEQVKGIFQYMYQRGNNILATRANNQMGEDVCSLFPDAEFNPAARTITLKRNNIKKTDSFIAIVAAGTSDLPVVEEAFVTAEMFGNSVKKVIDVGVAGIHRLFERLEILRSAKVLIVVAGMEGALPSVVAGLVDKPVIAVPTSIGYGANFGGLSALLAMLNSCSGGVSVVNIDNGFGAAYQASMINKL